MDISRFVHTFGSYLKARYGERVHKLSLAGDFTCPNRDGTLGKGGCTFCNVRSFGRDAMSMSISEQIQREKQKIDLAKRYLAYFQAYTSTYAEVETLKALYEEAMVQTNIVGLCIGTRPDCVPDAALDLLAGYQERGFEVWLELGLQSAQDVTLARINRGHGFAAYRDAVERAQARALKVCTHLIVGLPGETPELVFDTLQKVLDLGVEGIKLHPLMIVRGSRMAAQYRRGEITPLELPQYASIAANLIRHTPPEVIFHRVAATAQAPTLIAPEWCAPRWAATQAVADQLAILGPQGSALGRPWSPAN